MDIQNIKAINGFIIRPLWNRFETKSGIYTHAGDYSDEQMPPCYMPIEAEIIAAPPKSKAKKGDTLYFTWNALSFQKCISNRKDQNLFYLDNSYFAYRNSEGLFCFEGWALLDLIVEQEEVVTTKSGIVLSGLKVQGQEVVQKTIKRSLEGKVAVLPEQLDLDIKVGDTVKVERHTDVEVEVGEQKYYRVRLDDIYALCSPNN